MGKFTAANILLLSFLFVSNSYGDEFYASITSNKYHLPKCKWAKTIKPKKLIKFDTPEKARDAGYIPCRYCKPPTSSAQKDDMIEVKGGASGKEFFNKGYMLSDSGNYGEAIKAFSRGIEISPEDSSAYYNRGLAYAKTGKYEKAIKDFNKAIELNPSNTMAYTNRGVVYLNMKKYEEADEDFNMAIRLDPRHYWAYYNKACLYSLKDELAESCRWLEKAIEEGYDNWEHIKKDRDINNVRGSSCYGNLMHEKQ